MIIDKKIYLDEKKLEIIKLKIITCYLLRNVDKNQFKFLFQNFK